MTYVIEKGIPVPPEKGKNYPFLMMEIGDSFILNKSDRLAGPLARSYGKRHGLKFRCQKIGPAQTRIWRVA